MLSLEDAAKIATEEPKRRGYSYNEYLAALGVPEKKREAVRSYGRLGGAIGLLPIQAQGDRFDVVEDGQVAAVLAAYWWLDDFPVDLVAVTLDAPKRVLRFLGHADALGEPELERARYYSCPTLKTEPGRVVVHATALDWLRSGCEGGAILDRRRTPLILSDIDEVIPSPAMFALNLHRLLHQHPPQLPRVMVPKQESIAA